MTNNKRQRTMQDIIQAAIVCIEEYGLANTTIRKISEKAGVNSAAISYYFGSREQVISRAFDITLDNAFDFDDFIYKEDAGYRQVLKVILNDWKKGALAFPGLFHAHIDDITNRHIKSSNTRDRVNEFIEKVYKLLVKHGLVEGEANYKRVKLIFGAFIATLIMPDTVYLKDANDQVDVLVEML